MYYFLSSRLGNLIHTPASNHLFSISLIFLFFAMYLYNSIIFSATFFHSLYLYNLLSRLPKFSSLFNYIIGSTFHKCFSISSFIKLRIPVVVYAVSLRFCLCHPTPMSHYHILYNFKRIFPNVTLQKCLNYSTLS